MLSLSCIACCCNLLQAMEKLHQLDVFGSRLVVEYAKTSHSSVIHEAKLDKYVYQHLHNMIVHVIL